jgi:hypothetical protein
LQGLFTFFLGSDALGVGVVVILRMHTSGVKHMQRVTKLVINVNWLFPQEKLMIGVLPLVSEPNKNRPYIDEWRGKNLFSQVTNITRLLPDPIA